MSGRLPNRSETSLPKIVEAIRDLFAGRSNAVGELTLTPNSATTTVNAMNCGPGSRIFLTPRTANAAAALANVRIAAATTVEGQFVITHANNAQTDREFGYAIQG